MAEAMGQDRSSADASPAFGTCTPGASQPGYATYCLTQNLIYGALQWPCVRSKSAFSQKTRYAKVATYIAVTSRLVSGQEIQETNDNVLDAGFTQPGVVIIIVLEKLVSHEVHFS